MRRPIARVLRQLATASAAVLVAGAAVAESPMPAGYPGRGRIGIEVQPMTAELREFFHAPPEQGLLIVRVEVGRPADVAQLAVGDVVIAAADQPLVRPHDLVAIVARAPSGEPLELVVVRAKKTLTIEVRPEGQPASAAALQAWHERLGEPRPPEAAVQPAAPAAPIQPVGQPMAPGPAFAPGATPLAPRPEAPAPAPLAPAPAPQ
jgi:serine protease Do